MQCHEAFLDVGTGTHFLGTADQHSYRAFPDLLEQCLLLGVGFGVADGGDLIAGNALLHQFGDDLLIRRIPPRGRFDAHIGEDHLRAASRFRSLPGGNDIFYQPIDLRFWEILCRRREHPGVGSQFATVGSDGESIIHTRIDLLRPQAFVAFDQFLLEVVLFVRHRTGNDGGFPAMQAGTRQVQHLCGLHVGEGSKHLLKFG